MREFKYDVISLIHNVRDRPCLWDKSIENYKDRMERRSAWEEIFNNLDETYEEMSAEEKRITGELILHKWTNIRDTFIKSLKTKMGKPKKKYLLYEHLEFLTKIIHDDDRYREIIPSSSSYMKQEGADSGFSLDTGIDPDTSPSFSISNVTSYKKGGKGSNPGSKSNDFTESEASYAIKQSKSDFFSKLDYTTDDTYSQKSTRAKRKPVFDDDGKDSGRKKSRKVRKTNEEAAENEQLNSIDFVEVDDNDPRIMNEDEAFFASLLPTVVKYSEEERLEFRIQVLGVMKNIKNKN